MTSAAQPDLPQGRTQKRILSAGHNAALLRVRNTIIETAGYHVVTTKESDLLLDLLARQPFDAIVLCSSIPAHIRENIAREVKALKPKMPLVIICSQDEEQRFARLADQTVRAEEGVSQPLIEAISRLAGDPED